MKRRIDGDGYTLLSLPDPAWLLDKDQPWAPGLRKPRRHLPADGQLTPKRSSLSELDGELDN